MRRNEEPRSPAIPTKISRRESFMPLLALVQSRKAVFVICLGVSKFNAVIACCELSKRIRGDAHVLKQWAPVHTNHPF